MTTHRRLAVSMRAYRIGDPAGQHPVWSAEGARRVDGRWHERGDAVIYASRHYSTAILEKLAHWNGLLPPNQHFLEITIPAGTSYEVFSADHHPDWFRPDGKVARRYGHDWCSQGRSAVLVVPSVVARMEENVLVNPGHSDAGAIQVALERPVWWDGRLFGA